MKRQNGGVLFQYRPHDFALDADPPAVNDSDLAKAALNGLIEVFLHDNMNLLGLKRMEIDGILDWDVVHDESI